MGWQSSDTAELSFDDCWVPADAMLGEENRGFYAVMQNFQNERIVLGAQAMGEAQKAIDLTLEYVRGAERVRDAVMGQTDDPPAARHVAG